MADTAKKIEWDDAYLLGIPDIDMQHKKLILIANELYDVVYGDEANYKLKMSMVLKKLTDYTEYHFTNEEQLQKRIGYPGLETHKNSHDYFIKEVRLQIQKLNSESKSNVLGFYNYIATWVFNHIAKADRLWATYMKENSGK